MKFVIKYHQKVASDDIPKISRVWREKIKKAIEKKLQESPEVFGKPLRNTLREYRSLRVGDYRIIFRIERKVIKIFVIQKRSEVYKNIERRY